jgi:ATP adenylyltransferase
VAARSPEPKETLTLFRSERALVMINRYPYTNGHLMVAPIAHEARLFDSTEGSLSALIGLTAAAQRILSDVYHPDGFNVGMNFGQIAGAGVADHYHMHIVPRWSGDSNFMTVTAQTRLVPEDLEVTFDKLAPLFREMKDRFGSHE